MPLGKGLNSLISAQPVRPTVLPPMPDVPTSAPVAPVEVIPKHERLWQIPISEIIPNSEQPRRHFGHEELENLVASIKEHGILQPITVTERPDGGYELIAGERRWRAAQIAGLAKVPALVRSVTEQEKLELALIENIQRQNLNPIEEAFAYQRLIEQFHLTQQEAADRVGKSRPVVANTIRLLQLPEEIQRALMDNKLSAGKARAILSLQDQAEQVAMFRSMMGEEVSVRDIENEVAKRGPQARKGSVRRDPNVLAAETALEKRLGSKARIHIRGAHGTIEISFSGRDELQRILEEMDITM